MIHSSLQSTLESIVEELDDLAPSFQEVLFCEQTPDCPEYLTVVSPTFRFVNGLLDQGQQNCSVLMEMDVIVTLARGCVPQLDSRGNPPSASRVSTANERAYGLRERFALAVFNSLPGGCLYKTTPTINCDIEGTSYLSIATYTVQVRCLDPDVSVPDACAGCG